MRGLAVESVEDDILNKTTGVRINDCFGAEANARLGAIIKVSVN
jgi:hypothetical protein